MGPENHLLHRVVLASGLVPVRKPLHGEGRPFERVGDDEIVEERRVLLPDLVFFVDESFFDLPPELLFVFGHGRFAGLGRVLAGKNGRFWRVWFLKIGGRRGEERRGVREGRRKCM